MNILHLADTHLGYTAYRKTTSEGINQREQDTYDAFEQIVDKAIQKRPDVVLHAGDLFDMVRPNNRAISCAIQQINRLVKHQIPVVVIAGNHEQPRLKETGHIFQVFEHIDHVYPVYQNRYETIALETKNGKLVVHAVPQCTSQDQFKKELQKISIPKNGDYHVFLGHGSVRSIKEFSMNEFNELFIPESLFQQPFDYIALGHYHKYSKLQSNMYYAGSSERFTFADAGEKKGFINVHLGKKLKTSFETLTIRPMIDISPISCEQKNTQEVMKELIKTLQQRQRSGALLRVRLNDIPQHVYRGLDFQEIRKAHDKALYCDIKITKADPQKTKNQNTTQIGALLNEFHAFIDQQKMANKKQLKDLGTTYIEKIEGHHSQ